MQLNRKVDETAVDVKMTTIIYIYTKKMSPVTNKVNMALVSRINTHNQERNVLVFWDQSLESQEKDTLHCCELETRPTFLTSFTFAVTNNSQQKYTSVFLPTHTCFQLLSISNVHSSTFVGYIVLHDYACGWGYSIKNPSCTTWH